MHLAGASGRDGGDVAVWGGIFVNERKGRMQRLAPAVVLP
jgi:hypothetical protein